MARVVCETGGFIITESLAPEVLSMEMTVDDSLITCALETTLAASSSLISGLGPKTLRFSHKELRVLPHEVIAQCRGMKETDQRLSKIRVLRDAADKLTPDGIVETDEAVHVLEIKTSRINAGLDSLFQHTRDKYKKALEDRIGDKKIIFSILIVCPTGVYTNLIMTREEADILVSHYLLACAIQDKAKTLGWNPDSLFDEEIAIQKTLSKVTLGHRSRNCRKESEPLHITEKMVRKWDELPLINPTKIFDANFRKIKGELLTKFSKQKSEAFAQEQFDDHFAKFVESFPKSSRGDKVSAAIHLPLVPIEDFSYYDPDWRSAEAHKLTLDLYSPYGKLWTEAFLNSFEEPHSFEQVLSREAEKVIKEKGYWEPDQEKVSKSKRYVVKVPLNEKQRLEFASRGVQAKKMKRHPDLEDLRAEKKLTLNLETETEDIEQSFNPENLEYWLGPYSKNETLTELRMKDLLAKAYEISGCDSDLGPESFVKAFLGTRLGLALSFLDEVISEVNISRLKNVGKDFFVLKRLPNYEAYLLVKPTTSEKHVFFSLLIPKRIFKTPLDLGETFLDLGAAYCTKFISVDRHKISHILYCHLKAASMYCFWNLQFGNTSPNLIEDFNLEAAEHFWMGLLVFLEDKEKTSTALQLVRYAYMEVVKGGVFKPNPGKIFKKMDPLIRSRILVFCIKRIRDSFREMSRNPPEIQTPKTAQEGSQDKLASLLSWVTGKKIKNFEIALNLSYLGVLHNKEEGDLLHGYLKIFDKVIDQELKLKNARREHLTRGALIDPDKLRDHEFSAVAVKSFAECTKAYLARKHGDYDAWAASALSISLLRRTFEDLATSKASAEEIEEENLDEEEQEEREFSKAINDWRSGKLGKPPVGSRKCIENIYQLLESLDLEDNKVFFHFESIIKDLESSGGIKVKLFKKLQIGGTREIFILPIKARIVVNYLETISRCICEELPCEMLTKGDMKITRSDNHYKKRNQASSSESSVTVISSDDAATWAQRFVMPVFGVMINSLVPHPFKNACFRVLNLVTSKRLALPTELLRLFKCYQDEKTFNPNMSRLKDEFLDTRMPDKDRQLVSLGSNLMKNRSNMMQGILHYTSSLLHSCFMTAYSAYIESFFDRIRFEDIRGAIATGKVSSDDSALLISILLKRNADAKTKNKALVLASMLCYLKGKLYPLFCAKQSEEKSTVAGANLIEEFNSLWYFRNTLLTPSVKFVAASIRTHVTDKFESRQQVQAGLKAQVLENTGSFWMAGVVQACQARAHYHALGAGSSPLFCFLAANLLKAPHPCLGFYIFEPSLCAGLLGYRFAFYLLNQRCVSASRVSRFMMNTTFLSMEETSNTLTTVSLTQGSRTRYHNMLDRMGVEHEQIMQYYDDHPDKLYDHPKSTEDIKNKIAIRALNPSMANTFEFLTDSKQHAASSYLLHAPCVTIRRRLVRRDEETQELKPNLENNKTSLAGFVYKVATMFDRPRPALTDLELEMLFPNKSLYDQFREFLVEADDYRREITYREKKSYVVSTIPKYGVTFLADPCSAVKSVWFALPTKYTTYEIDQTFSVLKTLFPWVKESYTETLVDCPLGSSVPIYQFLNSLPTTSTSIRVLTASFKKTSAFDTLKDLVKKAQWPAIYLASGRESTHDFGTPSSLGDRKPSTSTQISEEPEGWSTKLRSGKEVKTADLLASRNRAHALATALWLESSLPERSTSGQSYKWTHNKSRVLRLLSQLPDVVQSSSLTSKCAFAQLSPNEATLAIFQHVVKRGTQDVSVVLEATKRGVVGHFTQRAEYDPTLKKYMGPATFRGRYNGVLFELGSFNEGITKISVRLKPHLKTLAPGFMRICQDLRCRLNATQDEVRRAFPAGAKLEFVNLKSGEIFPYWQKGLVGLELKKISDFRSSGIKVTFTQSDDKVLRLVDTVTDSNVNERRKRTYTILSYFPVRPKEFIVDWDFQPFELGEPLEFGIKKNPYDLFLLKNPPKSKGMKALIKSACSTSSNSAGTVYPGLKDWLRKTLKARAESALGMMPVAALVSEFYDRRKDAECQDILHLENAGEDQELNLMNIIGGENLDDFTMDEFDDIFEELDMDADMDSSFTNDETEGEYQPGDAWADYDVEEVAELTEFEEFRPMADYSTIDDPLRHSPFWDKFLEELKQNSTSGLRAKAFAGKCVKNCSEAIELVARLFNEDGKPIEDEDEDDDDDLGV